MHLKELKKKTPAELVEMAEELGVEGASTLRKQDLLFAILKVEAENGTQIMGMGTIEVLQDGFGFLRSPEANYLAGPDDIYVSPNQVRKHGLRTGDTVEGEIRGPKDGERYFALNKVTAINFDDPDVVRHRVNFDNLTPLRLPRPNGVFPTWPEVAGQPRVGCAVFVDSFVRPGQTNRPLLAIEHVGEARFERLLEFWVLHRRELLENLQRFRRRDSEGRLEYVEVGEGHLPGEIVSVDH